MSTQRQDNLCMEFLERFVTEDPRIKRIHISHNDLDGYGCNIVLRTAMDMCGLDYATIETRNIDAGINSVAKTIRELITDSGAHYMVLITDLVADPVVLTDLNAISDTVVEFAIIDHHDTSLKYAEEHKASGLLNRSAVHTVDTERCATSYLHSLVLPIIEKAAAAELLKNTNPDSYAMVERLLKLKQHKLLEYVNGVFIFDTGKWGKWYTSSFAEVDAGVMEQVIFAYYKNVRNSIDAYLNYRYAAITHQAMDDTPLSQHLAEYFDDMKHELDVLREKSSRAFLGIPDITLVPISKFMTFPKREVWMYSDTTPMKNFSMVSKEWFILHPNAWLLIYINLERHVVELRSGPNGANCAEIAELNGGGGHFHAAGFPLR